MNATDVRFSNQRRARRASRGEVTNMGTSSTTRESSYSYARRASRDRTLGMKRTSRVKSILTFLAVVAVVLAVGLFVASRVFFGLTGGRAAFSDKSIDSYLTPAAANAPYYALVVADLDETNNCDTDVDMVVLARIDEQNKALTCVSIPSKLKVALRDGNNHPLSDAVYVGGYGELLRSVISLADVDVSHIISLTQKDIEGLVDSWGGLEWNLTEEVDDPQAGSLYIPAGQQTLTGNQVTTFLRAKNFAKGIEQQGLNQGRFVAAILQHSAAEGLLPSAASLDNLTKRIHTDWKVDKLMGTLSAFAGFQASSAYVSQVPCYQIGTSSNPSYSLSATSWQAMMAFVSIGANPYEASAGSLSSVDPGSFSITVRNGSGITGGAASIASTLSNLGFNVEGTGNTDSYVYTETLIIYLDDAMKPAADTVCNALGTGRVIDGTNHYNFDTDVLVVLGSDWMPQR